MKFPLQSGDVSREGLLAAPKMLILYDFWNNMFTALPNVWVTAAHYCE
jgi:hypothetical protein